MKTLVPFFFTIVSQDWSCNRNYHLLAIRLAGGIHGSARTKAQQRHGIWNYIPTKSSTDVSVKGYYREKPESTELRRARGCQPREKTPGEGCGQPILKKTIRSNGGGKPFNKIPITKGNSRGKPGSTELLNGRGCKPREQTNGERFGKPALKEAIQSHAIFSPCKKKLPKKRKKFIAKARNIDSKVVLLHLYNQNYDHFPISDSVLLNYGLNNIDIAYLHV